MKNLLLIAIIFVSGCVANPPTVKMTPLEIQNLQSREFEAPKDIVFASVVSVFQDLAYTIKSADKSTGFITAESAADSDFATKFWLGQTSITKTAATGFVEQIGKMTKVRLNFVSKNKRSTAWGREDQQDTPILDAKTYQTAFEKIENAIFVRKASQ